MNNYMVCYFLLFHFFINKRWYDDEGMDVWSYCYFEKRQVMHRMGKYCLEPHQKLMQFVFYEQIVFVERQNNMNIFIKKR